MITRNSKHEDFLKLVKPLAKNLCGIETTAINYSESQLDYEGKTFGETLDEFIADEKIGDEWVLWILFNLWNDLSPEVRLGFMQKIKDPSKAFYVYVNIPNSTKEEDKYLEDIFKEKLPESEKLLKNGEIKRKKNG